MEQELVWKLSHETPSVNFKMRKGEDRLLFRHDTVVEFDVEFEQKSKGATSTSTFK